MACGFSVLELISNGILRSTFALTWTRIPLVFGCASASSISRPRTISSSDCAIACGLIAMNAVGLFYYAGHGVQLDGVNYLIPVGANIDRERRIKSEAVSTADVMDAFEFAGNELNLVILDACRNNPYPRGTRSASRGLATMNAPTGTLIAYATAPGDVASDGDGDNSPYSSALAAAMQLEGVQVEQMFKTVARSVRAETGGDQTPWVASSLIGEFWFNKTNSDKDPEVPELISQANTDRESRFWRGIQDSVVVEDFKEYLRQFPDGTFEVLAQNRISDLREETPMVPERAQEPSKKPTVARAFDSSTAVINTRNVATRIAEQQWEWSAFIDTAPEVIDHVICVEYTLHKTFTPQVRTVCDRGPSSRPYALHTAGWGTFKLKMRVTFDDGTSRQLVHQLSFRQAQDR